MGGTISQFLIERCTGATCSNFVQVGTSAATTYNDTGLLGSTTYNYRVRATDTTNNTGPYSNTASATTAAPTFTAPSALTATASGPVQINLSWSAATETGGTISQYLIERCQGSGCSSFAQVATSNTTNFNDTGLLAGTTYSYRVRATDAANNVSPYSNVASATTTTTPPPPTLVQHVSTSSNSGTETGNGFKVNLPNAVLSGNLVICGMTYNYSTNRSLTITDNNGGQTWVRKPHAGVNDKN